MTGTLMEQKPLLNLKKKLCTAIDILYIPLRICYKHQKEKKQLKKSLYLKIFYFIFVHIKNING